MPINLVNVSLATQKGLSVVCATCKNYWDARDRAMPDHKCLAQDGCGSPLRGGSFHEYVGPITDLSRWCFVCGVDAAFGIRTSRNSVGVCRDHLKLLSELRPVDDIDQIHHELSNGQQVVSTERLFRKNAKKTLGQMLFEVDSYYEKKNSEG